MHLDPAKIPGYVKGHPPNQDIFRKISFTDELEAMWGRKWGAQSKVGKLSYAIVMPPSDNEESDEILEDPVFYGLPDGVRPNLEKMRGQYNGLVKVLQENGVELEEMEVPQYFMGPYCRNRMVWAPASAFVIDGGAIVPRYGLAPWRKGLEGRYRQKTRRHRLSDPLHGSRHRHHGIGGQHLLPGSPSCADRHRAERQRGRLRAGLAPAPPERRQGDPPRSSSAATSTSTSSSAWPTAVSGWSIRRGSTKRPWIIWTARGSSSSRSRTRSTRTRPATSSPWSPERSSWSPATRARPAISGSAASRSSKWK